MNRYPLWRYALIAVLIVLGVLYAVPNLYGEDPAVQISSTKPLSEEQRDHIDAVLQKASIKPNAVAGDDHRILYRFADTADQLKAQGIISGVVDSQVSVALNLADKTPAWLLAIGAKPMKLGLDLRGGIHFLMQVDVKSGVKTKIEADMHAMLAELRRSELRYTGFRATPNGLTMRFANEGNMQKAESLLELKNLSYTFAMSKKEGLYQLQALMSPKMIQSFEQSAVSQNITILRNRINQLGVAEPVVQQQGKDYISVDLPGIQDTARAKKIIGTVATLSMHIMDSKHDPLSAERSGVVPYGSTLYKSHGYPVLLNSEPVLTGSAIVNALATLGEDGRPSVRIQISGPDVSHFNRVTGENVRNKMGVVYTETKTVTSIVDGKPKDAQKREAKLINLATINSALGSNFNITGLSSMQEAQNLALFLRSGAYSTPIKFVSEQVVGPSMGKENIAKGEMSTIIGLLVVVLFMMCYYRFFGFVANCALVLNVLFIFSILSLLDATLTLPGIAGIVLTIGMAVDANVLINERVREELRAGMSIQGSIHAGYARAFSTIVDANVTTLIVAIILFGIGSGPVKNFAITLTIGLLTSMVSSIFFTRAVINAVYGDRPVKRLSIGIRVKEEA